MGCEPPFVTSLACTRIPPHHETLTITWLRLVTTHAGHSDETDFDAFLAANEGLLDQRLPSRHFSRDRRSSAAARCALVEPDIARLLPEHTSDPVRGFGSRLRCGGRGDVRELSVVSA